MTCLIFIAFPFFWAAFPGEPHANLLAGRAWSAVECGGWISYKFDRLHLNRIAVVDDEKINKIEQAIASSSSPLARRELARSFRGRNFSCADLSYADLRRVDLADAQLSGIKLEGAQLRGASLEKAHLHDAKLTDASLPDAVLDHAKLHRAHLYGANLQGASLQRAEFLGAQLYNAKLQAANLTYAKLNGASLFDAHLEAAELLGAELKGAYLGRAYLQGANLHGARLDAAALHSVQLQGASLFNANLQRAVLDDAELQGVSFFAANLDGARIPSANLWRTTDVNCAGAHVASAIGLQDGSIAPDLSDQAASSMMFNVPDGEFKKRALERIRFALGASSSKDKIAEGAKTWKQCETSTSAAQLAQINDRHEAMLLELACDSGQYRKAIAYGIALNLIARATYYREYLVSLATTLLGGDGRGCGIVSVLNEWSPDGLRNVIEAAKRPDATPASVPQPGAR